MDMLDDIPETCPRCGKADWHCTAVEIVRYSDDGGPTLEFNGEHQHDSVAHAEDPSEWSVRIYCTHCTTYFPPTARLYDKLAQEAL